ncbi:hypothetical protein Mapa_005359 [Marchantia paleacea]|nr:hypothetical protein Mapa_005359 [Marchantia paleacea]
MNGIECSLDAVTANTEDRCVKEIRGGYWRSQIQRILLALIQSYVSTFASLLLFQTRGHRITFEYTLHLIVPASSHGRAFGVSSTTKPIKAANCRKLIIYNSCRLVLTENQFARHRINNNRIPGLDLFERIPL